MQVPENKKHRQHFNKSSATSLQLYIYLIRQAKYLYFILSYRSCLCFCPIQSVLVEVLADNDLADQHHKEDFGYTAVVLRLTSILN